MIDFEQIKGIATAKVKSFGRPELADDFVQFTLEALLRGRKATVAQLFIDFVRQEFGDNRAKENREFKFNNSVEWEEYMDQEVLDQHDLDFTRIVDKFEGTDRSILILHYVWGMTLKEIGYAIGVTESRVCQMKTEIDKKLIKRYGNA